MAPMKKLMLLLAPFAVNGAWNPANGTKELDAVEAALHSIVDNPRLSPAQLKMAKKTVADVDQIVAQIQGAKGLTKQAKMQKVGQALEELQDLQGQFQLNTVQQALHKMEHGHLTNEVAKSAKEVAQAVDKVAEELESGSKGMTKEQKNKMVAGAIQKLQGLQGLFEKSLGAAGGKEEKLETLEKELALKKTELARSEDMLKLAKLQKELATKKEELRELESKKASSKAGAVAEEKEKKEQEELVAKLVGMAKDLKTTKGGAAKDATKPKLPAPIQAIVTSLQAKATAASAEIAKLDNEEMARERKADEAAKEASQGKDAAKGKKLSSMLKFLAKEEKHTFTKLRAAKEHNLSELQQAIKSIENGDVSAVQKVMSEMQHDVKSFDAKSHNFLY